MYRVILVDDQSEVLEWLRLMLEGCEDFQVVGEASGAGEAKSLIDALMPNLVIADIDMPGQDGLDMTREVHLKLPNVEVILMSTHSEQEYERLAKEEGAISFIPKASLSPDVLRRALAREA